MHRRYTWPEECESPKECLPGSHLQGTTASLEACELISRDHLANSFDDTGDTMAKTIAEVMVESLKNAGIKRVYGLPGDSVNGFTDALRKDGTIEWAHVRNEEVAAFAAGAEAHLTGSLAVCAASCGPGNLHFINGLFDCHRSRVPVLAIAAHIPSHEIGSNYFQETHPQNLFRECSDYCEMVGIAAQMPRTLEIAMRTAMTRSAVSVL